MTRGSMRQMVAVALLAAGWPTMAVAQQTVRVSVDSSGGQARGGSYTPRPVVSANGTVVAFQSPVSSFVANDTNGSIDVFVVVGGVVTRVLGASSSQLNCAAERPSLSSDGLLLAFDSCASNVVAGDTNSLTDVFVLNRGTDTRTRVSVSSGGAQANGPSFAPAISPNGRYVAFLSTANNLVAGVSGTQVYLHDRNTAITSLVSRASGAGGAAGNLASSGRPSVADDGTVAFTSAATNLVGGDTNGVEDVFVRVAGSATTVRASVAQGGGALASPSSGPSLSANGRFVAFTTAAQAVQPADGNPLNDVYLRDLTANATILISRTPAGTAGNGSSFEPAISSNGAFVAFSSLATDIAGAFNAVLDVYRATLVGSGSTVAVGTVTRFSEGMSEPTGASSAPAVADDGRVVFASDSTVLVANDTNGDTDVFMATAPGVNQRLSMPAPGVPETYSGRSTRPQPSFSGNVVAFLSSSTTLVAGDVNGSTDVFVHTVSTGVTERLPVPAGLDARDANWVSISHDGRWVAYSRGVVFLHDRSTGTTIPVSVAAAGAAPVEAAQPKVSPSGRHVAFTTLSSLVAGDNNGTFDVYVFDRITGTTTWASRTHAGTAPNGLSSSPGISGDGTRVSFESTATNLVSGPVHPGNNVYVRDLVAGTTTWVSNVAPVSGFDARDPAISADGQFVTFLFLTSTISLDGTAPSRLYVNGAAGGTPRGSLSAGTENAVVNDDAAYDPTLSMFGRFVAFRSYKEDLVVGDTNGAADAFARQIRAGSGAAMFGPAQLASPAYTGGAATGGSIFSTENPEIAGNGTAVGFQSGFTNLVMDDTNGMDDAFVRLGVFAEGECAFYDNSLPPGYGMWIQSFGIDPCSDQGSPFADPDGDGFTNEQERGGLGDGNPILGAFTRYFAEGATKTAFIDFDTRIALANPNAFPVTGEISYQMPGGAPVQPTAFTLKAYERTTVLLDEQPGIAETGPAASYEFATTVKASAPIGVDRTMTWDKSVYAAHAETGVVSASRTWYFAEGATIAGFNLFYLLQNPTNELVSVEGRYLLTNGQVFTKNYLLEGNSRYNVWANAEPIDGGTPLASAEFSAVFTVTSGPAIIAERAMYRGMSPPFKAGHESAGITEPATEWFLAEGNAGDFFDMFVLIGNPTSNDALVEAQFIDGSTGAVYTAQKVVGRTSRDGFWVDETELPVGSGQYPFRSGNTDVSVRIRSLNNVPIIVERAMWWPGNLDSWYEAHNSAGTTQTSSRWVLGEGEAGGPLDWQTYILVANTGDQAGTIRMRLLLPDGVTAVVPDVALAAQSRTTFFLAEMLAAVGLPTDTTAGVLVESVGAPLPLVVERAMYRSEPNRPFWAGTNALGTPLP